MNPMHDMCQSTAFFSDHKRATSTYIRDNEKLELAKCEDLRRSQKPDSRIPIQALGTGEASQSNFQRPFSHFSWKKLLKAPMGARNTRHRSRTQR